MSHIVNCIRTQGEYSINDLLRDTDTSDDVYREEMINIIDQWIKYYDEFNNRCKKYYVPNLRDPYFYIRSEEVAKDFEHNGHLYCIDYKSEPIMNMESDIRDGKNYLYFSDRFIDYIIKKSEKNTTDLRLILAIKKWELINLINNNQCLLKLVSQ